MNSRSEASQRLHRAPTLVLFASAVVIALGAAWSASAAQTFTVDGTDEADTITLKTAGSNIEACVASFTLGDPGLCFDIDRATYSTIVVNAHEGDDVLVVDHADGFVTDDGGALSIAYNGGPEVPGRDALAICPDGCAAAGIETTVVAPSGAGQGAIDQATGSESLAITFTNLASIADYSEPAPIYDRSPGAVEIHGTDATNSMTYTVGSEDTTGLVTIDALAPYEFSSKSSMILWGVDGRADTFVIANDLVPDGLDGDCGEGVPICVYGGSSTALGDTIVANQVEDEQILRPLGFGSGEIDGLAAPVFFDALEHARLAGVGGTVVLEGTDGSDVLEVAPGASADRGSFAGLLADAGFPLVDASFSGMTGFRVDAAGGDDSVELIGTTATERIELSEAGGAIAVERTRGAIVQAGSVRDAENIAVSSAGGADVVAIPGDLGLPVLVDGGGSASTLVFSAAAGDTAIDLGTSEVVESGESPVSFSNIGAIDADLGGQALTVTGTAGGDTLRATPSAASSGAIARDGSNLQLRYADLDPSASVTIDPADGYDHVIAFGSASADTIEVTRGAFSTVSLPPFPAVGVPAATTEALTLDGSTGSDLFSFSSSGGPDAITVIGGLGGGNDQLNVEDDQIGLDFGLAPGSGVVATSLGEIGYEDLKRLEFTGSGGALLALQGTSSGDVITQVGDELHVGGQPTIGFGGFSELEVNAGSGPDTITFSPGDAAVSSIRAAGGPGTDTVAIAGTSASDDLTYEPGPVGEGVVGIFGAPEVTFETTETIDLVGNGGHDLLHVLSPAGPDTIELGAGVSADAGTILVGTRSLLRYSTLGAFGEIVLDNAGPAEDLLTYRGTAGVDTFEIDGTGPIVVSGRLPVHADGVATVRLEGMGASDTVRLAGDLPFERTTVAGGSPNRTALSLDGPSGDVTVDLGGSVVTGFGGPVAFLGLSELHIDAGGETLAVRGTSGPDDLTFTPTEEFEGTVARTGSAMTTTFEGATGGFIIDPIGGSDNVTVTATQGSDDIVVDRDPGLSLVSVNALKQVALPSSMTESLSVSGGNADDRFTVTGDGGPATLTFDGGAPVASDRIDLITTFAEVTYGAVPTSGVLDTPGGKINFSTMEVLGLTSTGDPAAELVVNTTNASDQVSIGGDVPSTIRVNAGTLVEFSGYPSLTVNGRGGQDTISSDFSGLDPALESVSLLGGDPGADPGDTVIISDEAGASRLFGFEPTGGGSGRLFSWNGVDALRFELSSTELLRLNGQGGDDLLIVNTPPGSQAVTLTPGSMDDAGHVRVASMLPISFEQLGEGGTLTAIDDFGDRSDRLVYRGSTALETFEVVGHGPLLLDDRIPVIADGADEVRFEGLGGDDEIAIHGPLPYGRTTVAGGSPNHSTLSLDAPVDGVAVDLGRREIGGFSDVGGIVSYTGLGELNLDVAGETLVVEGTSGPDQMTYTPTGDDDGTITMASSSLATRFDAATDLFVLDAGSGSDLVNVVATQGRDDVLLTRDPALSVVQINALKEVSFPSDATEALFLTGGNHDDTFTVEGDGGPDYVQLDGGAPVASDTIIAETGFAAITYGETPTSGTLETDGGTLNFSTLEIIDVTGFSDPSDEVVVNGTNAADSISVGGEAPSQVRVNDGTVVRFAGYPTLTVTGRGGADTISADHDALDPTLETIAVAGGDPAGAPGDTLIVNDRPDTTDRFTYAPTGSGAGVLSRDDGPTVEIASTETFRLNGQDGDDQLVVRSPAGSQDVIVSPGEQDDAGRVRVASSLPIAFEHLGADGSLETTNASATREDKLIAEGTPALDDIFMNSQSPLLVNGRIPVIPTGARDLVLEGLGGEDTFTLRSNLPFRSTTVNGGTPSTSVLNLVRAVAGVEADLGDQRVRGYGGTVWFTGLADLNLDANGMDLRIVGTRGPDEITYEPATATSGIVTMEGFPTVTRFTIATDVFELDAADGSDQVTVLGSDDAETIDVSRGDPASTVQVGAKKMVDLPLAATEALVVEAGNQTDVFELSGRGGPGSLTLDGGLPATGGDRIITTTDTATVTYSIDPTTGVLDTDGDPLNFVALETIDLTATGGPDDVVIVHGTNAPDAISFGREAPAKVRVNDGTVIEFTDYPILRLDGHGGSDTFSADYANIDGALDIVDVVGGDPASDPGDAIRVNDTSLRTSEFRWAPTGIASGTLERTGRPDLLLRAMEAVTLNGNLGGDHLIVDTPVDPQNVTLTPGTTDDAGVVEVAEGLPLTFEDLGPDAGHVTFLDHGYDRTDRLTIRGTDDLDRFAVTAMSPVTLNARIPVDPRGVRDLVLDGDGSDDTFDLGAPLPFATTTLIGGSQDDVDVANLLPPASRAEVDYEANEVVGYGGTIRWNDLSTLNTAMHGGMLTDRGTAAADTICYEPLSPNAGRVYLAASPGGGGTAAACASDERSEPTVHRFTGVGLFTIDPGVTADSPLLDETVVNGTPVADHVTVRADDPLATGYARVGVAPNPNDIEDPTSWLPVRTRISSTHRVHVTTGTGSDRIDVRVDDAAAPLITIDAGGPATDPSVIPGPGDAQPGDELIVRDLASGTMENRASAETHAGSVLVEYPSTTVVQADYEHVEAVTLIDQQGCGCKLLVATPALPAVRRGATWLERNSLSTGPTDHRFDYGDANPSAIAVMGDWDGDGIKTPGTFENGTWRLRQSNTAGDADLMLTFGEAGDLPVVGDWTGSGSDGVGVFRAGLWLLRNELTSGPADFTFVFGSPTDVPVTGDWNGDDVDTPGTVTDGTTWRLRNTNSDGTGGFGIELNEVGQLPTIHLGPADDIVLTFGAAGEIPIVGDWTGDGHDGIGTFRDGHWQLREELGSGGPEFAFTYGMSGDRPLVWG